MFTTYVATLVGSVGSAIAVLVLWGARIWASDALLNERLWHTQIMLAVAAVVLGVVSASFYASWDQARSAFYRD